MLACRAGIILVLGLLAKFARDMGSFVDGRREFDQDYWAATQVSESLALLAPPESETAAARAISM